MDRIRPDIKQNKRKRRIWLGSIAGVLAIAVTAVLATLESAAPTVPRDSIFLSTVQRGELIRQVRGPGTLVPSNERWIAAATDALVEQQLIKPGALVKPETVILEMSNPELSQALQEAELELEAGLADHLALEVALINRGFEGEARLAEIRADYLSAKLQVEAEADLFKNNIISRLDYERSKLREEQLATRFDIEKRRTAQSERSFKAELDASQARLERLRNMLVLRQEQTDGLIVRAGIEGVLQEVLPEVGQRVNIGTALARVARTDSLLAELRIPEVQAKDLLLDQPAVIDTRNGTARGRVVRIDPAVVNGSVTVDIEFVDPLPDGARPDLSVTGTIQIDRLEDVVYVGRPVNGQAGGYASLFRLDPDDTIARRVQVRLGRGSVNEIEVVEGLQPGDRVILSDLSQWENAERIKLD